MANINVNTTPQKKRKQAQLKLMIIAALGVVILLTLATMMSGKKVVRERAERFGGVEAVGSEDVAKEVLDKRLRELEKAREDQAKLIQELESKLEREGASRREAEEELKKRIRSQPSTAITNRNGDAQTGSVSQSRPGVRKNDIPSNVVLPPTVRRETATNEPLAREMNTRPSPFTKSQPEVEDKGVTATNNAEVKATSSRLNPTNTDISSYRYQNDAISAKKELVKNDKAGFLPATSAIPIVIYTGVDALTGSASQSNPEPVHFRLQDDGFLPGDARYRLTGCHGQGSAFGDLSSQRVKVTATRIVCLDVIEDKILETPIVGYLTDSDNISGFRGEVKNREGVIAGKAFAASFIEGAADLVAASTTQVTTVDGAAIQSVDSGTALRGGFAAGSSNAAAMLAERYIEQMEAIMPTIPLEAGRKGVLHIQQGTVLEWTEYSPAYIEKITPVKGAK